MTLRSLHAPPCRGLRGCTAARLRGCAADAGFSLAELLVAATLAVLVFGAVSTFIRTHTLIARAQPDAADLQQRARAAVQVLSSAVAGAGAWSDRTGPGPGFACCVPSIVPRRIGLLAADTASTAHPDVLTVVRVAPGAVPGRLRDPLPGVLTPEAAGGCTSARPVCGLQAGDLVMVFRSSGLHDFFVAGSPGPESAPLTARQAGPSSAFVPGDSVVGVEAATFYFDASARQLRLYDGYRSDVPIVDDVVAVRFEYWGTPGIPAHARGAPGVATCWFDSDGAPRFGRALSPAGAADVRLSLDELRDGPWCGAGGNTFDADLLRVRRVRAVVRLRAAPDAARGRSVAFLSPGSATSALRLVNDLEVTVDATSRALSSAY